MPTFEYVHDGAEIYRRSFATIRAEADLARFPDDVARVLGDQGVTCGWIRASGVLTEVELRVFDASIGGLAESRRITGPVQALSIEGSVGLDRGEASLGLRAVLAILGGQ